ncbi:MAG TPA: oligosaccharide flippase family protein [Ignavibacteriaceae bacterium]|nr:oligosaccharide flippase family protein [Ignavibacteriaceae bacterium]
MPEKSLTKSVAWYSLGNIFIRSLSFILLPLYSNLIPTKEFGNYALLLSIYAIASVFYQFGMHGAFNKYFIAARSDKRRIMVFSTILNFVILSGIILTVLFFIFAYQVSIMIFGDTNFVYLLKLIFAALFIETLTFYILFLLKTKEESKKAVTYSAIGAIFNLVLNILFVYFLKLSVSGIILAQLISSSILLILLIGTIKDDYIFKIDKDLLKGLLKFSYPLAIAGLFSSAVDVADRFILNDLLGREQVGIYSFAYRIALVMNVFVISFRSAWSPHSLNLFYSKDYKASFGKTLSRLVAVSCILLLAVSLFAGYLFEIRIFDFAFFNSSYKPGIIILPLVIIGYIFSGISSFYSVYPYIANKSYHFLISDFIALGTNIILNFILIPQLGLLGAAFATAIGFLFGATYLFFISREQIKIDYQTKNLTIIIMSALLFLLIGLNVKNIYVDIAMVGAYLFTLHKVVKLKISGLFKLS